VQGAGQVGSALIRILLARGVAQVVASEACAERRATLLDAFAKEPVEVRLAAAGDAEILAEPCDVLAPCALGAVLGPETIPTIRAAVVCGSANNPLVDEEHDALALQERGIVCVPDVIANRMGIVQCANEQYGRVVGDPAVQRHLERSWEGGIYRTTLEILERARARGVTPTAEAIRRADEQAEQPHPIWGHRSRQIIDSLLADGWEQRAERAF
jgi:glutamate dehydrogenase/leucine dehydrogenase